MSFYCDDHACYGEKKCKKQCAYCNVPPEEQQEYWERIIEAMKEN